MRIAIPTNDMTTVSAHFGRSKGFMIYDLNDNKVSNFQYILNTFTSHAKNKGKEHDHGKHKHSHDTILNSLAKCNVVIAGGMGKRLYNDFDKKGIQVYVTQEKSIHKTIELLIKGVLDNNTTKCCNHQNIKYAYMEDISIFTDKSTIPTNNDLLDRMGGTYPLWQKIREIVYQQYPDGKEDWNYPVAFVFGQKALD